MKPSSSLDRFHYGLPFLRTEPGSWFGKSTLQFSWGLMLSGIQSNIVMFKTILGLTQLLRKENQQHRKAIGRFHEKERKGTS
jgi:hypothetical protein